MDSRVKNAVMTIGFFGAVSLVTFAISAYVFGGKTAEPSAAVQRDLAVKTGSGASSGGNGPEIDPAFQEFNKVIEEAQFHADVGDEKADQIVQFNNGKEMADFVRDQKEAQREAQDAAAEAAQLQGE
jgi:hypothetical protein